MKLGTRPSKQVDFSCLPSRYGGHLQTPSPAGYRNRKQPTPITLLRHQPAPANPLLPLQPLAVNDFNPGMTTPTAKSSFRRQFRRKPNASIPAARHTRPKPMKTPCGMTDQQAIPSQGIKPPLPEPTVRRQPESNRISLCRRQLPRRVGTPAPTPLTNPIAIDTTHPRKHCLALRHPVQGRVTGPILRAPLTNATTIDPTIPPRPCPALRPTQPGHAAGPILRAPLTNATTIDPTIPPRLGPAPLPSQPGQANGKPASTRPTNPTANDATNPQRPCPALRPTRPGHAAGQTAPTRPTNPTANDATNSQSPCQVLRPTQPGHATGPILRAPLTNATVNDAMNPQRPCRVPRPTQPGHAAGKPTPTRPTNPTVNDATNPQRPCRVPRRSQPGHAAGKPAPTRPTNPTANDATNPQKPCPVPRPSQPGHAAGKQTPTRPTNPTANDATNPPTLALNANQMQRATRIGSRPPSTVPIQIATAHGSPQLHPQRRRPARRVLGRRQPPTVQATAPVHLPPNTLTSIQKTPIRREPQSHQLTLPGDLT